MVPESSVLTKIEEAQFWLVKEDHVLIFLDTTKARVYPSNLAQEALTIEVPRAILVSNTRMVKESNFYFTTWPRDLWQKISEEQFEMLWTL